MALLKGLLGRKVGMTQVFTATGETVSVTVLQAGPCLVVQRRTADRGGYDAVQLGFEEIPRADKLVEGKAKGRRRGGVNRPRLGHFQKAGVPACRHLQEFRLVNCDSVQVGDRIGADIFAADEVVDVTGTSKGRGFAGGMRRYGFHGGPATHGSMSHRRPGSSGATDAARTFLGTRKPGHMGAVRVTVKSLRVLSVDPEKNLILVKGPVPGARGGLIRITRPYRAVEEIPAASSGASKE